MGADLEIGIPTCEDPRSCQIKTLSLFTREEQVSTLKANLDHEDWDIVFLCKRFKIELWEVGASYLTQEGEADPYETTSFVGHIGGETGENLMKVLLQKHRAL